MKRCYFSDFFQSTRTDQNSFTKFYEILWCQIEPLDLLNWTKKIFSFLSAQHTIPGETKGSPFCFFNSETFFENFSPKAPSIFWCFATMDVKKFERVPPFRFFRYCKRILDTSKSFCYFWALDMAPTYAVPGLLYISVPNSIHHIFVGTWF